MGGCCSTPEEKERQASVPHLPGDYGLNSNITKHKLHEKLEARNKASNTSADVVSRQPYLKKDSIQTHQTATSSSGKELAGVKALVPVELPISNIGEEAGGGTGEGEGQGGPATVISEKQSDMTAESNLERAQGPGTVGEEKKGEGKATRLDSEANMEGNEDKVEGKEEITEEKRKEREERREEEKGEGEAKAEGKIKEGKIEEGKIGDGKTVENLDLAKAARRKSEPFPGNEETVVTPKASDPQDILKQENEIKEIMQALDKGGSQDDVKKLEQRLHGLSRKISSAIALPKMPSMPKKILPPIHEKRGLRVRRSSSLKPRHKPGIKKSQSTWAPSRDFKKKPSFKKAQSTWHGKEVHSFQSSSDDSEDNESSSSDSEYDSRFNSNSSARPGLYSASIKTLKQIKSLKSLTATLPKIKAHS